MAQCNRLHEDVTGGGGFHRTGDASAIGGIGAYIIESALKLPPVFPLKLIVIGILVSVAVGITAGIYPARKAALMNPVDALRHE